MECVAVTGRWDLYTATASTASAAKIISSISSRLQVQGLYLTNICLEDFTAT